MEPKPNTALKVAIAKSPKRLTQRALAKRARIHEVRLSGIACGRIIPSKKEQRRIARAIGASVDEIFGDAVTA